MDEPSICVRSILQPQVLTPLYFHVGFGTEFVIAGLARGFIIAKDAFPIQIVGIVHGDNNMITMDLVVFLRRFTRQDLGTNLFH